jgi:hypothetical protein
MHPPIRCPLRGRVAVLVLVAGALSAAPALAQEWTAPFRSQPFPHPWLAFSVALSSYSLSDANDEINSINAIITPLHMDEIHHGVGLGGALGVDATPEFTTCLRYERLGARSEFGDIAGNVEYSLPANLWAGQFEYRNPSPDRFTYGFGAAIGIVSSAGRSASRLAGHPSISKVLHGTGLALEGFVTGDWHTSEYLTISPMVGYRRARIGEVKSGGMVLYDPDGSHFTLDYSGLVARVMVKFGTP